MSKSALEAMCAMTTVDMHFLNAVFVRRRNGEPSKPSDIAPMFKDCSTQRVAARLTRMLNLGVVRKQRDGQWIVTETGLQAMKFHYRQWSEVFSEDDERKALAA